MFYNISLTFNPLCVHNLFLCISGDTPRLIPEKGTPNYQTMERMRDLLDNVPNALITFGCLKHPELTGEIKMSPQEIKARQSKIQIYNI